MGDITPLQTLAAAYHGDQYAFVQESNPGTAVYGALWFKPSTKELRIWFMEWILLAGDTLGDVEYNNQTGELTQQREDGTYIITTAVPCP